MDEIAVEPLAPNQLRITVEIGEEYEPTERLASVLQELAMALEEAGAATDEVVGFASFQSRKVNFVAGSSYRYDSLDQGGIFS